MLAVFTFGINMSDIINNFVEKSEAKREEKLEQKQKNREEMLSLRQEKIEQKRKEIENKSIQQMPEENIGEQIKINFGGRVLDEQTVKETRKKYNHDGDDLVPLTKETKKLGLLHKKEEIQPDVIENNIFKTEEGNLFKTEEEKKVRFNTMLDFAVIMSKNKMLRNKSMRKVYGQVMKMLMIYQGEEFIKYVKELSGIKEGVSQKD